MTVREMLHRYLTHLEAMDRKDSTIKQSGHHVMKLADHFGSMDVVQLAISAIDEFVWARRQVAGLSPASVNGSLRVLRAALKLAVEEGALASAPKVRMLKEARVAVNILTPAEQDRLFDSTPIEATLGLRTNQIMAFAAFAGLRHQEILHLRHCDIDIDAQEIHIRIHDGWAPKSHAERSVPMSEKLERWIPDGPGFVARISPGGEIRFLTAVAKPGFLFQERDAGSLVRAAFKRAGLYDRARKPGLHMLRRTFASRLLSNGASIETVRDLLGHANIETTQRYLAASTDEKRAAVEGL